MPSHTTSLKKPRFKKAELAHFFLVAATVMYSKDQATVKQRSFNIIVQVDSPLINQVFLKMVHDAALARVHAENNILPANVLDIIVVSVTYCGQMTQDEFRGTGPDIFGNPNLPSILPN